jgi:hypothetical protein
VAGPGDAAASIHRQQHITFCQWDQPGNISGGEAYRLAFAPLLFADLWCAHEQIPTGGRADRMAVAGRRKPKVDPAGFRAYLDRERSA